MWIRGSLLLPLLACVSLAVAACSSGAPPPCGDAGEHSGSVSPGGGPYRYTAPIQPAQAATLAAAFNGGFKMNQAGGGYYTEGRVIDPLRTGAASLVIYADGSVDTADGALVYVAGPALDPLQVAQLLARAGAVRGMQLDINPNWPVFVTYDPPAGAPAAPANGRKLLSLMTQGPWTFLEASWARDFITMSARS